MSSTRIPTQKRSIEKRNKIIEKGFELICQKGYHNISTPDIAEASGVSTGIIYQYFTDKKEIFLEGVRNYSNSIMFPMIDLIDAKDIEINDLEDLLRKMINSFVKNHKISKKAHEELMAMSHLDNEVANIFKESEFELTNKVVKVLEDNNLKIENSTEKIHIAIGIIENLCHEIVYHKHRKIDYEVMEDEVIHIVTNLLKN